MIKNLIALIFLTWSSTLLFAQEDSTATSQKWNEMKQVTPSIKETNQIYIFDDPRPVYQLELKDNQPFNGYEISEEKLLGEFNFINFYKDGELVAKYAIDYLNLEETANPRAYTLKTTYKKGEIYQGNDYRELLRNALLVDQFTQGKRTAFYLDLFAIHYFNRLSFQLSADGLIIHNMETNNELHIYKKAGVLQADFYQDKKRTATSTKSLQPLSEIAPNASTIYYLGADKSLQEFTFIRNEQVDLGAIEDEFLQMIFSQFSFEFEGDLSLLLETAHATLLDFEKIEKGNLASLFQSLVVPYKEENYLAAVYYNALGKPEDGKVIQRLKTGEYEVKTYENGELKAKNEIRDLRLLQSDK